MSGKIRVISILLVAVTLFGFSSCVRKSSVDAIAIAEYLQCFDKPETVIVNKIEKSVFADEIIYYISRSKHYEDEADEIELLIVYYPSSNTVKTAFFLDMEYGMHADIKALWDSREIKANSTHVFSADEIKSVTAEAAEYCSKPQS